MADEISAARQGIGGIIEGTATNRIGMAAHGPRVALMARGGRVKTLALIPARAGSKSIPGKNKRLFNGEPLYVHAVKIGIETCTDVAVSTDDEEILADVGGSMALAIKRPAELAQDDTPMSAVIRHALTVLSADVVVLLQPTQPLRTRLHVLKALSLLEQTGADSVVSVVQIPAHYSPDYAVRINHPMIPGARVEPFIDISREFRGHYGAQVLAPAYGLDAMPTRRQDARTAHSRDGTVYAIKRETIEAGSLYGKHCEPLIIPANESCNLDTEEDWQRAEAMVSGRSITGQIARMDDATKIEVARIRAVKDAF